MGLVQRLHPRHHPLVAMAATELGQPHAVGVKQAQARLLGALNELPHAGVAARRVDIQLKDGLGRGFEANAHRMETEQDFGRRHAPIIPAAHPRPRFQSGGKPKAQVMR